MILGRQFDQRIKEVEKKEKERHKKLTGLAFPHKKFAWFPVRITEGPDTNRYVFLQQYWACHPSYLDGVDLKVFSGRRVSNFELGISAFEAEEIRASTSATYRKSYSL